MMYNRKRRSVGKKLVDQISSMVQTVIDIQGVVGLRLASRI